MGASLGFALWLLRHPAGRLVLGAVLALSLLWGYGAYRAREARAVLIEQVAQATRAETARRLDTLTREKARAELRAGLIEQLNLKMTEKVSRVDQHSLTLDRSACLDGLSVRVLDQIRRAPRH